MQNLFQSPFCIPSGLFPLHLGVLGTFLMISKSEPSSLLKLFAMCLANFYK